MPTLGTLDDVAQRLLHHLNGAELARRQICTRVLLRTGVNILKPRPDQSADPTTLNKIIGILTEMGYAL